MWLQQCLSACSKFLQRNDVVPAEFDLASLITCTEFPSIGLPIETPLALSLLSDSPVPILLLLTDEQAVLHLQRIRLLRRWPIAVSFERYN